MLVEELSPLQGGGPGGDGAHTRAELGFGQCPHPARCFPALAARNRYGARIIAATR